VLLATIVLDQELEPRKHYPFSVQIMPSPSFSELEGQNSVNNPLPSPAQNPWWVQTLPPPQIHLLYQRNAKKRREWIGLSLQHSMIVLMLNLSTFSVLD
jgi:hypothetical protein